MFANLLDFNDFQIWVSDEQPQLLIWFPSMDGQNQNYLERIWHMVLFKAIITFPRSMPHSLQKLSKYCWLQEDDKPLLAAYFILPFSFSQVQTL